MATNAAQAIRDCQSDAVILAEMLDGISLMSNEGKQFDSARVAVTVAALDRAKVLAEALDQIKIKDGE
ncbi:hypothetical protein [uncultured Roseovarius sp.]|uniref:hypothetical protein n=1 Tax=uncultured Roseovarius sp. TaxID=293344 RepID=UPI0025FB5664|nr:hypothetical protein [uncultured Roseovarius sp.]